MFTGAWDSGVSWTVAFLSRFRRNRRNFYGRATEAKKKWGKKKEERRRRTGARNGNNIIIRTTRVRVNRALN